MERKDVNRPRRLNMRELYIIVTDVIIPLLIGTLQGNANASHMAVDRKAFP